MNIIELLSPKRVVVDLPTTTPTRLFARLSELMLPEAGAAERSALHQALLAREKMASTTLGLGLAVPHGRVASLSAPVAAFIRLKRPMAIHLNSATTQEVDLIFAFATPSVFVEPQLKLLAQIASLFDDQSALHALRTAANSAVLFERLNSWYLEHL